MCKVNGFYYIVLIILCILVLVQFTPDSLTYYIWGQESEIWKDNENYQMD